MIDDDDVQSGRQPDLFQTATDRALLDRLIEEYRLYTTSNDYKELLDFVVRLRNFAPFNAMLLQVQKPGLTYAMSLHPEPAPIIPPPLEQPPLRRNLSVSAANTKKTARRRLSRKGPPAV